MGYQNIFSIQVLLIPFFEITSAVVIGLLIGYIAQHYISMVNDKTKKVVSILTAVVLSSALSSALGLSSLIANLAVGVASSGSIAVKSDVDTFPAGTFAGFDIANSGLLDLNC